MDTLPLSNETSRRHDHSRTAITYEDSSRGSIPPTHSPPTSAALQKSIADTTYTHTSRLSLTPYNNGYFLTSSAKTPKRKRSRIYPQPDHPHMSLHQSTCLNLDLPGSNDESELWILPDFDEWEADAGIESPLQEVPPQSSPRSNGEWATALLTRAVNSNRERLRRRLEGDGWDFVGGKYGDDGKMLHDADTGSQESVDEEFDVVVLPLVEVSC